MTGGIIIYVAQSSIKGFNFWLIALPVGIITLSLTFLKVQDQPFAHFLGSLVLYFVKPRRRIWHKLPELEKIHNVVEKPTGDDKKDKKIFKGKTISEVNLEELSYVLDTRGLGEKTHKAENIPKSIEKNIKPLIQERVENAGKTNSNPTI